MVLTLEVDQNGATIENVTLSDEEELAIEEAHEIVSRRCAEAGVKYAEDQRRLMYWCFMGALRIGGVNELMRYAREAKICGEKKTVYAGYDSVEEMEDLI